MKVIWGGGSIFTWQPPKGRMPQMMPNKDNPCDFDIIQSIDAIFAQILRVSERLLAQPSNDVAPNA